MRVIKYLKLSCLFLLILFSLKLCFVYSGQYQDIICRDPDVGGDVQNNDRTFLLLGKNDYSSAGIGNLLIFFPAVYYFALVTSRDIIINDQSIYGEMCRIIQCGFPMLSHVKLAFPNILNSLTLSQIDELKAIDFNKYMEKSRSVTAKIVRAGWGITSKSDWWVWYNSTAHCVQRITGCILGDIMCAERHAYQRLIRGPFISKLINNETLQINGMSDMMIKAILRLPHAYAPRLDASIHLRLQFNHFEKFSDLNNTKYHQEVTNWLASNESTEVFEEMKRKILNLIKQNNKLNQNSSMLYINNRFDTKINPLNIYLASDNEEVKVKLFEYLHKDLNETINIMKLDTEGIFHMNHRKKLKNINHSESLLHLLFDWYILSLSNQIYAWRKSSTNMLSTFVHSAQKVSGTIEKTDTTKYSGMGTKGYQLIKNKKGKFEFILFWMYGIINDI